MQSDLVASTVARLSDAGMNSEHADWVRSKENAALVIRFISKQRTLSLRNLYATSVESQLADLRRANNEEKWGITEEDFARLAATAPAWPQGKQAYRSFRIRFGEGSEGVRLTFERHLARIKAVFGENGSSRWEGLDSAKGHLRLLNGDDSHRPVIEWVIVDLGTHCKRNCVADVRSKKSLADELLVVTWMFPDMIRAIPSVLSPGLFAAGYEFNLYRYGDTAWRHVVFVNFYYVDRRVYVGIEDNNSDDSRYAVPVLLP